MWALFGFFPFFWGGVYSDLNKPFVNRKIKLDQIKV